MTFEVSRVPQKDQMGTGDNFWSLGAFKSIIAAMMHPKGYYSGSSGLLKALGVPSRAMDDIYNHWKP